MKKLSIAGSLQLIEPEEWKEFEKFAASPYFNKGRNYLPLLKVMKKFHPDFQPGKLSKEIIYKKLFPGKKFKTTVLNVMFSGLNALCNEFLIQQQIKKDASAKRFFLIKELGQRNDFSGADRLIDEYERELSKEKIRYRDYDERIDLLKEKINLFCKFSKESKIIPFVNDVLKLSLYRMLYEICEFKYRQISLAPYDRRKHFKDSYEDKLISCIDTNKILDEMKLENKDDFLKIYIMYLSNMMHSDREDDISYFELKKITRENLDFFDRKTIYKIYSDLLTLSQYKKNRGKLEFNDEIYLNLTTILDGKYYKAFGEEGYMHAVVFRNIILDFINSDLDRVKHFSGKYIDCFHPNFRDSLQNYSKAWISYAEKEYDKALVFANKVELESIVYKLDLKILTSMIYYETHSCESLFALLNTYDHFLRNNFTQDERRIEKHKTYVRFLRELTKIKVDHYDEYKLRTLRGKISAKTLINKGWLLQKISELESGIKD